jgi:hypothetical protein
MTQTFESLTKQYGEYKDVDGTITRNEVKENGL